MDPITIILGGALAVCVVLLFRGQGTSTTAAALPEGVPSRSASATGPDPLAAELQKVREDATRLRSQLEGKENELRQVRKDHQALKSKQQDRQKSWEREKDSLSGKLADAERRLRGLASAEDAREQVLGLERKVRELEGALRSARGAAPVVEAAAVTVGEDVSGEELERLRNRLRTQARELRDSFVAQVQEERQAFREEVEVLRRRLKKALNDADRESRRTASVERAYAALKGQFEATLDRLASIDPSIRRPDAVDPATHLQRLQERRARPSVPVAREVGESVNPESVDPAEESVEAVAVPQPAPGMAADTSSSEVTAESLGAKSESEAPAPSAVVESDAGPVSTPEPGPASASAALEEPAEASASEPADASASASAALEEPAEASASEPADAPAPAPAAAAEPVDAPASEPADAPAPAPAAAAEPADAPASEPAEPTSNASAAAAEQTDAGSTDSDDDGWFDDEVEAKLGTGEYRTV